MTETESLLDKLRELDGKATPGPWDWRGNSPGMGATVLGGERGMLCVGSALTRDAPLIAEARNALPAVVALVEAAQAFVDSDHELVARIGSPLESLEDALAPFVGGAT